MNEFVKTAVIKMAIPVVQAIIKDIVVNADLKEIRDSMISWLMKTALKTKTPIDDKLASVVAEVLFTPEYIQEAIEFVLPILKEFVIDSSTKWDDQIFLPVLEVIEVTFAPTK